MRLPTSTIRTIIDPNDAIPLANDRWKGAVRDKIIYLSRSVGSGYSMGRHIINEPELLESLRNTFPDRTIKVFKSGTMDIPTLQEFFSDAAVIVSPHGGSLYNMVSVLLTFLTND